MSLSSSAAPTQFPASAATSGPSVYNPDCNTNCQPYQPPRRSIFRATRSIVEAPNTKSEYGRNGRCD